MTDESNIASFSYHRKSMGDLQRNQEVLAKEIKKLHEYRDWQDMVLETLEVQLSEFKAQQELMVTNLLDELKKMNSRLDDLKGKKDGN